MPPLPALRTLALVTGLLLLAPPLGAQGPVLGTFRWQLQPFCNVLTVTVIQQGAVYTVDGYDDQCGAPQRAPLVGLATANPDGTIGLGLHLVTVPVGGGLQIDAGSPWSPSTARGKTAPATPEPSPSAPVPAAVHGPRRPYRDRRSPPARSRLRTWRPGSSAWWPRRGYRVCAPTASPARRQS